YGWWIVAKGPPRRLAAIARLAAKDTVRRQARRERRTSLSSESRDAVPPGANPGAEGNGKEHASDGLVKSPRGHSRDRRHVGRPARPDGRSSRWNRALTIAASRPKRRGFTIRGTSTT